MEVFLDNRQSKITIKKDILDLLKRVVKTSLEVLNMEEDYEVSISFVDKEEIRELNRDYRGVDSATDVLSFPIDDDMLVPLPLLGDIIVSLERALEQSKDYNHSLEREVAYLTAHSMLHLCGYDHMEEEEKKDMRDKEKEIMKKLGIFKNSKKDKEV